MPPHWLLRMSQLVRHPPSIKKVKLVFGVFAVLLMIYAIEAMGWWPDTFTAQRMRP